MKNVNEEEPIVPEMPEQAPEQVQETPKGRARALQMFREKYPDKFAEGAGDPEDDDMYEELMQSTSDKDSEIVKLSEANDKYHANSMKLVDLIDANPDLAELFSTLNDDDEFLTSIKSRKENQKTLEANAGETIKNVMSWQEEEGVSEDERIARVEFIVDVSQKIENGIISREMWDYAGKALNHDSNMESAVVAGKNAAIDQKRAALKKDADVFPDATPKSVPTKSITEVKEAPMKKDYFDELETIK